MSGLLAVFRHRGRLAALAGTGAILAVLALWLFPRPAARDATLAPAGRMAERTVPVVLYLVDTLRADRLGVYGYSRRATTPRIDALAAESVLFEQAYGPAPWTLPSVTSILTSTYACEHGVVSYGRKLHPDVATLTERLARMGFLTAAYTSNFHAGPLAGLSRGYRIFEERPTTHNDRAADTAAFLSRQGAGPFFLYLHTMEPHEPFHTPARLISRFGHVSIDERETYRAMWLRLNELRSADWSAGRTVGSTDNSAEQREILRYLTDHREGYELLYDAAVAHADEHVGRTVDVLRSSGLWDRTLFILLADHGEEFGEHGDWLHGQSVYEEQLHVPLLVHFPRAEFAGQRIAAPVSLVDVMPTVLDYLGEARRCEGCRGRSLLPLLNAARAENASVAAGGSGRRPADLQHEGAALIPGLRMNQLHYYRPVREQRGDVNVVVRRAGWKAIWNAGPGTLELYDLGQDPAETVNAGSTRPDVAGDLHQAAARWLEACRNDTRTAPATGPIDPRTREKLRAMGYIR